MFTGTLYDARRPPTSERYHLTDAQLRSLAASMQDVPVRLEHGGRDVGRVARAAYDGRALTVDWELDDNTRGWATEKLIVMGVAPELSLSHLILDRQSGAVKPLEVSIVREGARPGCAIESKDYKAPELQHSNAVVMASATDAAPAIEPPAAAPAEAQEPAAGSEPAAKRARYTSPSEIVKDLSSKLDLQNSTHVEVIESIANYLADEYETKALTENEMKMLRQAKDTLEQGLKSRDESSKHVVGDIVETLSQLFQVFANGQQLAHKDKLIAALSSNPELRESMQPLVVAASAIHQRTAATVAAIGAKRLETVLEQLGRAEARLGAVRGLAPAAPVAAAAAVAPNWTVPAAAEVVAASAAAPPPMRAPQLPPMFQNMPSFSDAGGMPVCTKNFWSSK